MLAEKTQRRSAHGTGWPATGLRPSRCHASACAFRLPSPRVAGVWSRAPAAHIRSCPAPASRGRLLDKSEDPSRARRSARRLGPSLGRHDHARSHHREPGRAHQHHDDRLVDGHRGRQHRRVRPHACSRLQPDGGTGGQLRDRLGRHLSHRRPEWSLLGHAVLLSPEGQRPHRAGHRCVGSLLHDPEGPERPDRPLLHGDRRLGPGQQPRAVGLQPPGRGRPADDRHGRRQRLPERHAVRLGQQRARLLHEPDEARHLLPDARQPRREQCRRLELGELG